MQYLYHPDSSSPTLNLDGDMHRYLFKVRRHKAGDKIALRNLHDDTLYIYSIDHLDKKYANLKLESSESVIVMPKKKLHIGWCIIDPKNIEKVLPSLNEIGVDKITFIYCERSQKSFKLDFKRLKKILINSSQQSGRSSMIHIDILDSLECFLDKYPASKVLSFTKKNLLADTHANNFENTIVVGCEGGFHPKELALFKKEAIVGLDTNLILKSESAVVAVASKILL